MRAGWGECVQRNEPEGSIIPLDAMGPGKRPRAHEGPAHQAEGAEREAPPGDSPVIVHFYQSSVATAVIYVSPTRSWLSAAPLGGGWRPALPALHVSFVSRSPGVSSLPGHLIMAAAEAGPAQGHFTHLLVSRPVGQVKPVGQAHPLPGGEHVRPWRSGKRSGHLGSNHRTYHSILVA